MYDEFDYFNVLIHGIKPEHVADKPEFNELWSEIKPLVGNQFLIAHNADFDFSVLPRTLEANQLLFNELVRAVTGREACAVWVYKP
jgi:DNA polymerase-3 subunit epsilon